MCSILEDIFAFDSFEEEEDFMDDGSGGDNEQRTSSAGTAGMATDGGGGSDDADDDDDDDLLAKMRAHTTELKPSKRALSESKANRDNSRPGPALKRVRLEKKRPASSMAHGNETRAPKSFAAVTPQRATGSVRRPSMSAAAPRIRARAPPSPTPTVDLTARPPSPLAVQQVIPKKKLRVCDMLPDPRFIDVFPFEQFNAMQSNCVTKALESDSNLVIAAPTGSGKTVIFEAAICRHISTRDGPARGKIVFIAPIKALCSERADNWKTKFGSLELVIKIITGDTAFESQREFLRQADVIMTTPEKFDALTRRSLPFALQVGLLLVDEVHNISEDPRRGATLEIVVARMLTIAAAAVTQQKRHAPATKLRVVALSATMPNARDVAKWLGCHTTGGLFCFGPEFRPCPLTTHVLGYHLSSKKAFFEQRDLMPHVPAVIADYSGGKPTLVFCPTQASTQETASNLQESSAKLRLGGDRRHMSDLARAASTISFAPLKQLIASGIAFHHGGLSYQDRLTVERLFRAGKVKIVCSTSTLAQGVNLPAHLVVIKGTKAWRGKSNGGYCEYERSTLLQMIGRAGRPQFDTSGTAVLMTDASTQEDYENLVGGQKPLESSLLPSLCEALAAEIALGSVACLETALDWCKSTFLFQRMQQNPRRYGIDMSKQTLNTFLNNRITEFCHDLDAAGLSERGSDGLSIRPTEPGKIMAKFYLSMNTVTKVFSNEKILSSKASLQDVLLAVCKSGQLCEGAVRKKNKRPLRTIKGRFKLPSKGAMTGDRKALQLIQAALGGIRIPVNDLSTDAPLVVRTAMRITAALVQYLQHKRSPAIFNAVQLHHCLLCKSWELKDQQVRQLAGVGPQMLAKLQQAGIDSFEDVLKSGAGRLDAICGRTGFWRPLQGQLRAIPVVNISIVPASPQPTANHGRRTRRVIVELEAQPQPQGRLSSSFKAAVATAGKARVRAKRRAPEFVLVVSVMRDGGLLLMEKIKVAALRTTQPLPRFEVLVPPAPSGDKYQSVRASLYYSGLVGEPFSSSVTIVLGSGTSTSSAGTSSTEGKHSGKVQGGSRSGADKAGKTKRSKASAPRRKAPGSRKPPAQLPTASSKPTRVRGTSTQKNTLDRYRYVPKPQHAQSSDERDPPQEEKQKPAPRSSRHSGAAPSSRQVKTPAARKGDRSLALFHAKAQNSSQTVYVAPSFAQRQGQGRDRKKSVIGRERAPAASGCEESPEAVDMDTQAARFDQAQMIRRMRQLEQENALLRCRQPSRYPDDFVASPRLVQSRDVGREDSSYSYAGPTPAPPSGHADYMQHDARGAGPFLAQQQSHAHLMTGVGGYPSETGQSTFVDRRSAQLAGPSFAYDKEEEYRPSGDFGRRRVLGGETPASWKMAQRPAAGAGIGARGGGQVQVRSKYFSQNSTTVTDHHDNGRTTDLSSNTPGGASSPSHRGSRLHGQYTYPQSPPAQRQPRHRQEQWLAPRRGVATTNSTPYMAKMLAPQQQHQISGGAGATRLPFSQRHHQRAPPHSTTRAPFHPSSYDAAGSRQQQQQQHDYLRSVQHEQTKTSYKKKSSARSIAPTDPFDDIFLGGC